jgi:Flp pilus assembly protein TadD
LLISAIGNSDYPGIARATALSLLRPPYSAAIFSEIRRNLSNPDSLVRSAALSALDAVAPELIVELAPNLLSDPVRSVRIEAARVLSRLQGSLPGEQLLAFRRANDERIAAQLAIAERPEAHLGLGNVYADAGTLDQAEAAFQLALRLEPRAAAARVNLADLYARNDRREDAEQILREGIALNADQAVLHHSLGLMLVRSNQQDAALAELALAASLQPNQSRFVYVYAIALNSLDRPGEAVALLQDATERFPSDFDMHWALATMLRDQGRLEEAREVVTSLLEIYPQEESVRSLLQSL